MGLIVGLGLGLIIPACRANLYCELFGNATYLARHRCTLCVFDTVQLVSQRELRLAFLDYIEGDVTFNPTYKYDPGTDNWDSR